MKNNYIVNVGNIGNMEYTSKKLAEECYTTYVTLSKTGQTRCANEAVTLFKNGEIIEEYQPPCRLRSILDFDVCKQLVKEAIDKKESCVILCPHYSINVQSKYEDGEQLQWDLDELQDYIEVAIQVSDYDDLIVDLNWIYEEQENFTTD